MDVICQAIVDATFKGSVILVLFLLLIRLFKIYIHAIDKQLIIQAVSYTLLFGSLIYIGLFLRSICGNILFGNKDERSSMVSYMFGKYWFAPWFYIFMYALLPQILWVKKFNRSIISVTVVVLIWGALALLVTIVSIGGYWHVEWKIILIYCLKRTLIYLVLLSIMYIILSRRKKQLKPASPNL
ncbi:MAG TPA: hypothetical protein VK671_04445 [Mucilaginibacter sp.]|jgi:hypothetical protein|nr:hypothetical protein [Mucilaginibacter sp.]